MRPTAIVTGASRGLGAALARHLAAAGWDLVVDARSADELRAVAATTEATGPGSVVAVPGDITDTGHARELVAAARRSGRLELVVNNAGTLGPSPLPPVAELATEDLTRTLAVNVVAQLGVIRAALDDLRRNRGTIVDVTSDAAVEGYPGWGAYGASKAAFEQLSRVLAAEEPDVAVYWVDPGDMNTRMHQDAFPGEDVSDRADPDTRAPGIVHLVRRRPPSGRYRVEDLLGTGGTGGTGTGDPLPAANGPPGDEGPGTGDPDTGKPGTGGPGNGEPGTGGPDTGKPGTGDPDTGKPGTGDPGNGEPGAGGHPPGGTGRPGTEGPPSTPGAPARVEGPADRTAVPEGRPVPAATSEEVAP